MMSALAILALAAGMPLVSAGPVPVNNHFTLNQVPHPGIKARSFHQELQYAYQKHGRPGPFAADNAFLQVNETSQLHRRDSSEPTAESEDMDIYAVELKIGGQTLRMAVDTGSSDTWVLSTLQDEDQTSPGYYPYNPSLSHTGSQMAGETFDITFGGDMHTKGVVYQEDISIGGMLLHQMIGVATDASWGFPADGVLGLAFQDFSFCTPYQCDNVMHTMGIHLSQNLFTAALEHNFEGSFDFGYIDGNKYSGSITYAPIYSNKEWEFQTEAFVLGNNEYTSYSTVIPDTGTATLMLPDQIVDTYWAGVPGAYYDDHYQAHRFPCDAQLPNFGVKISGVTYSVPGENLKYKQWGASTCSSLMIHQGNWRHGILGTPFLSAVFAVFDVGNKQIGFAHKH